MKVRAVVTQIILPSIMNRIASIWALPPAPPRTGNAMALNTSLKVLS
jgi:hypothetical protein